MSSGDFSSQDLLHRRNPTHRSKVPVSSPDGSLSTVIEPAQTPDLQPGAFPVQEPWSSNRPALEIGSSESFPISLHPHHSTTSLNSNPSFAGSYLDSGTPLSAPAQSPHPPFDGPDCKENLTAEQPR